MTAAITLQRASVKCRSTATGRKTKMNSDELKSIAQLALMSLKDLGDWSTAEEVWKRALRPLAQFVQTPLASRPVATNWPFGTGRAVETRKCGRHGVGIACHSREEVASGGVGLRTSLLPIAHSRQFQPK